MKNKLKILIYLILVGLIFVEFKLILKVKEVYNMRQEKKEEFRKKIDEEYKLREKNFYLKD